MICTCGASDTDDSEYDYIQHRDLNKKLNYEYINYKSGAIQKPLSLTSKTDLSQRILEQSPASLIQQQEEFQCCSNSRTKRTSFNLNNDQALPINQQFPGQFKNVRHPQCLCPQQLPYQQPRLGELIQTGSGLNEARMPGSNNQPSQQNEQGCPALVGSRDGLNEKRMSQTKIRNYSKLTQNIQQSAISSQDGGLCFCQNNQVPADTGRECCAQENKQNRNNNICEGCCEFAYTKEPTLLCPSDDVEHYYEEATSYPRDAPPKYDSEKINKEKDLPQSNCCGTGPAMDNGIGLNDKNTENDIGKQKGFFQKFIFQISQKCDGGDNDAKKFHVTYSCDNFTGENENLTVNQEVNEGVVSSNKGKLWQEITLDIYQSTNGSSCNNGENSQKSDLDQKSRLRIYQEICDKTGLVSTYTNFNGKNEPAGKTANKGDDDDCCKRSDD